MDLSKISKSKLLSELNKRNKLENDEKKRKKIEERNENYYFFKEVKKLLVKFLSDNGMCDRYAKKMIKIKKYKTRDEREYDYTLIAEPSFSNNDYLKAYSRFLCLFIDKSGSNYLGVRGGMIDINMSTTYKDESLNELKYNIQKFKFLNLLEK